MDVRVQVPPSAPSFLKIEYARVVELADSLDSGSSAAIRTIFSSEAAYARVVELADSLDSGSSVLHGRAGSSPASRTMIDP